MDIAAPVEIKKKLASIGKHTVLRPVKVNIKTSDGNVIHGSINLGFENRLSDVFTDSNKPFVVMFDATISGETKEKALIINNHVF